MTNGLIHSEEIPPVQMKTGAIICKKQISGSADMDYHALLFIRNVPPDLTDMQLEALLQKNLSELEKDSCLEVFVRADIQATANEISEQFKGLNGDNLSRTIDFADVS